MAKKIRSGEALTKKATFILEVELLDRIENAPDVVNGRKSKSAFVSDALIDYLGKKIRKTDKDMTGASRRRS